MLPATGSDCYIFDVEKLVCPHCNSLVPERASVCVGCGAEVVRGATRAERSTIGFAFSAVAFLVLVLVCRAYQIARGSMPLPPPDSESALFYFLGIIAILVFGYMTGKGVARFFRRSQVRFFRNYRHQ